MALEDDILATLSRKPGLKGREIASQLGLDKGLVNSTLYKLRLRKLAWQDGGYRWFLKTGNPEPLRTAFNNLEEWLVAEDIPRPADRPKLFSEQVYPTHDAERAIHGLY